MKLINIACVVIMVSLMLSVDGQNSNKKRKKRCLCTKPGEGKPYSYIQRDDCNHDCIKCSNQTIPHYNKNGLCVQCTPCRISGQITEKQCTESHNTICVDPPPQAIPQEGKAGVINEKGTQVDIPVHKPKKDNGGHQKYNYAYIALTIPLGICCLGIGVVVYKRRYSPESEPQQDTENSRENPYENDYETIHDFQNNHNNYNAHTQQIACMQRTGNHSTQTGEHHAFEDKVPTGVHKSKVQDVRHCGSQVTQSEASPLIEVKQDTKRSALSIDSHSQTSLDLAIDIDQPNVKYTVPVQVTDDNQAPLEQVPSNRTGNSVDGTLILLNNSMSEHTNTGIEESLSSTANSMKNNVHSVRWRRET